VFSSAFAPFINLTADPPAKVCNHAFRCSFNRLRRKFVFHVLIGNTIHLPGFEIGDEVENRLGKHHLGHFACNFVNFPVDIQIHKTPPHHIRYTLCRRSGHGPFRLAAIPRASTIRVSAGSITPSSHNRAVE